ncbi:MAG: DUF3500 domain-containing protein [Chloroflexi bacterium]|nr:DUF3500 domain-containing protein [Chloroflexota bacterium]
MAAAARALLNSLSADQLSIVQYANLADPARTQWTNFPAGAVPRPGVALGDLNDSQRILLHNLLRASTSSQGYHKMALAMHADQVLHDLQNGDPLFGSANFYTTVFGNPEDASWAWMLTGHHMSALFTAAGDRTAFTPMFTGAQPLMVPSGLDAGLHVLPQDAERAIELLGTLSSAQQSVAILGTTPPGDLFAGPARQNALSTFQGVPSGQLDAGQQRLLWLLIEEYVRDADFDAADAQLTLVQQTWSDVHFAWQGPPPSDDARYYFRVHGPRILIEYDVQEPLTSSGGHVHALTRDPVNDYGMDWLGLHYQETNPQFQMGGPGNGGPSGGAPGGGQPGGQGGPAPTIAPGSGD